MNKINVGEIIVITVLLNTFIWINKFCLAMNYKDEQRERQERLIKEGKVFNGVEGGGRFRGKSYPYVLQKAEANLFSPIREKVVGYFKENKIGWWGGKSPSGNTLSSQIACLNHLAPIMDDADTVLAIINGIRDEFMEVLPVNCDKSPAYIAFEVVSCENHLNENYSSRGANCTSIDALVMAKHRLGKIYLILIEWKYTEYYNKSDKSVEGKEKCKGLERQRRYNCLIKKSTQLKNPEKYEGSVYYQDPFYQLMRQTLWAEQVIKHRATECLQADYYWHIHVVPTGNKALLNRKYKVSGKEMEDTWRDVLSNQSKYSIVDPATLFAPVAKMAKYQKLIEYLKARYW